MNLSIILKSLGVNPDEIVKAIFEIKTNVERWTDRLEDANAKLDDILGRLEALEEEREDTQ